MRKVFWFVEYCGQGPVKSEMTPPYKAKSDAVEQMNELLAKEDVAEVRLVKQLLTFGDWITNDR